MSLIDYLSSHCGPKKLHLTISKDDSNAWAAAPPFFNKSLVNLVDALEELTLIARFESPWNFCSYNSTSIGKCTKLKYLAMNVVLQLGEETIPTQWELPDDNVVVSPFPD